MDANEAADANDNKDRCSLLFLHLPVCANGDWSNDFISIVKQEEVVVGVGGRLHNIILLVDVDCDDGGGGGAGTLWITTTNPSTARIIATVTTMTMIMGVVMVVATAIALLPDLRPERHAISTHIDIDDDGPSASALFTAGI